jgi:hypothetical protein
MRPPRLDGPRSANYSVAFGGRNGLNVPSSQGTVTFSVRMSLLSPSHRAPLGNPGFYYVFPLSLKQLKQKNIQSKFCRTRFKAALFITGAITQEFRFLRYIFLGLTYHMTYVF